MGSTSDDLKAILAVMREDVKKRGEEIKKRDKAMREEAKKREEAQQKWNEEIDTLFERWILKLSQEEIQKGEQKDIAETELKEPQIESPFVPVKQSSQSAIDIHSIDVDVAVDDGSIKGEESIDKEKALVSPLNAFVNKEDDTADFSVSIDSSSTSGKKEGTYSKQWMFDVLDPFDHVTSIKPVVCEASLSTNPIIIPYHKRGKKIHSCLFRVKHKRFVATDDNPNLRTSSFQEGEFDAEHKFRFKNKKRKRLKRKRRRKKRKKG